MFSFGPEVTFEEFSEYNLLIGPNGTGKTNFLKILRGYPHEIEITWWQLLFKRWRGDEGACEIKSVGSKSFVTYSPVIDLRNREIINHEAETPAYLKILYQSSEGDQRYIEMSESLDHSLHRSVLEKSHGNLLDLSENVSSITFSNENDELLGDLIALKALDDGKGSFCEILNFSLNYIFDLEYKFLHYDGPIGTYLQFKRPSDVRYGDTDFYRLPSGVLQVARILVKVLLNYQKPILLIDEPELHIEPRILRAFLEILVWYCTRLKKDPNAFELGYTQKVNARFEDPNSFYRREIKAHDENHIFLREGNKIPNKQMFIASHSSILINEFIRLRDTASLYSFRIIKNKYINTNSMPPREDFKAYSSVRKIQTNFLSILDTLGCKGSDLLQCNGVVWVEGPSDVIYIRKWLEMYANEVDRPPLRQGAEYEFQMYGGSLLDSLSVSESNGGDPKEEQKKLVQMFSFSRNGYVVMDSDAEKVGDKITYKSNFENAKKYVKNQIESMNLDGSKLGLWYAENNTDLRTIEDYLDEESKNSVSKPIAKRQKKVAAQTRVDKWANKKLEEFPFALKDEIQKLYNKIESWQE